jgi:hypothetical protein
MNNSASLTPAQGPSTVWWLYNKHTEKILPVMGNIAIKLQSSTKHNREAEDQRNHKDSGL